jgi:PRC-barrel domain
MYRMLFLAMSLIVMGAIPSLTLAETPSSETVIVVPMNSLPSYGSLVSAWYKQPVYDTAEKRVGTVADMLFSADGSINAVMLDVGGFMGLGQKHVAVPLSAISLTKKKNKSWLTINTTKEAVKSASGYSYDKKDGVWNPR